MCVLQPSELQKQKEKKNIQQKQGKKKSRHLKMSLCPYFNFIDTCGFKELIILITSMRPPPTFVTFVNLWKQKYPIILFFRPRLKGLLNLLNDKVGGSSSARLRSSERKSRDGCRRNGKEKTFSRQPDRKRNVWD